MQQTTIQHQNKVSGIMMALKNTAFFRNHSCN